MHLRDCARWSICGGRYGVFRDFVGWFRRVFGRGRVRGGVFVRVLGWWWWGGCCWGRVTLDLSNQNYYNI